MGSSFYKIFYTLSRGLSFSISKTQVIDIKRKARETITGL
jgi:hypothetical protein